MPWPSPAAPPSSGGNPITRSAALTSTGREASTTSIGSNSIGERKVAYRAKRKRKLTTQVRVSKEPLHVKIPKRGDLEQACQVMTEQPRTLPRQRLIEGPLTRLTADEMRRVEQSFTAAVGLY